MPIPCLVAVLDLVLGAAGCAGGAAAAASPAALPVRRVAKRLLPPLRLTQPAWQAAGAAGAAMPPRRTAGRAARSPDKGGHPSSSRPTSGPQGQTGALTSKKTRELHAIEGGHQHAIRGAHLEEDTRVALGEPVRLTHVDQLRQLWKLTQPDGLAKLILAFGARTEGGLPRKVAPWLLEGEGIASEGMERHLCTISDHQGRYVALKMHSEAIGGPFQRHSEALGVKGVPFKWHSEAL